MPKRLKSTRERVVMSLALPKAQHTKIAKAARKSQISLAEFIRTASETRANEVLGGHEKIAA